MVTKQRLLYILEGKLITPIISLYPFYKKMGCWIKVVRKLDTERKPRRCYVGKLVKGERKVPTIHYAYRGWVKVTYVSDSMIQGRKRIQHFLAIDNLGKDTRNGFGKVNWRNLRIEKYQKERTKKKLRKLRIRKGLGPDYPEELKELLIALMLHDFVHTERHQSKIYQEVNIENKVIREACKKHHTKEANSNHLLPLVKHFDRIASYISRQVEEKTNTRYDLDKGRIDFEKLVKELETNQHSVYKLYNNIYHSKELGRIVESMTYSNRTIRNHLLLMVNLAINNYYNKWLEIENGKVILVPKEFSTTVSEKEKLDTTKDAEMHLFLVMNEKLTLGDLVQVSDERKVINKEKSTKNKSMGYKEC